MKKKFSQEVGEVEALESLKSLDLAVEKELELPVSETFLHEHTHTHIVCMGLCSW